MGLANVKVSRSSAAGRFFRRTLGLGSLTLLALVFLPGTAAAQTAVTCGSTLATPNTVYTLSGTISGTSGTCLTITASNVTLNLSGYSIDMTGAGSTAVAISVAASATNATIENGTIDMDYPSTTSTVGGPAAIEASGASGLSINDMTISNGSTASPCNPSAGAQNTSEYYGTGISLTNVAGASIGTNTVSCFQYGIYVLDSTVPSNVTGLISGNTVQGNTWYMTIGSQKVLSGGIVIDGSNGWTVQGNFLYYNGGPDNITGGCGNTGTGQLITCQFSLQVINGSSGNTVTLNQVQHGFTGGIYAGPDVSNNSFTGNTLVSFPLYGLFSSAPRKLKNSWSGNSCTVAPIGGTVSHKACG
jgi:hypothetical protein